MKSFYEFAVVVLVAISFISVPVGLFFLILGLSGRVADAELSLNVQVGLTAFAIGMAPPAALIISMLVSGHLKCRFSIRDLLWLTLVVAILTAWYLDHQRLTTLYDPFLGLNVLPPTLETENDQRSIPFTLPPPITTSQDLKN